MNKINYKIYPFDSEFQYNLYFFHKEVFQKTI